MEFAAEYERNDKGEILFPSDRKLRMELFRHKEVSHPGHNNLYMVDGLVEYLTKPGDSVLDPMAGQGSLMWSARTGRKVVLIELEPMYFEQLRKNQPSFEGDILLLEGDCLTYLPLPPVFTSVIFSPPYSNQFHKGSGRGVETVSDKARAGVQEFIRTDGNIGLLDDFMFSRTLKAVYEGCYNSLLPGGSMAIIIKDRMAKGKRVELGKQTVRVATEVGFTLDEWHSREAVGALFGRFNLMRGIEQVTDESIIIFRK